MSNDRREFMKIAGAAAALASASLATTSAAAQTASPAQFRASRRSRSTRTARSSTCSRSPPSARSCSRARARPRPAWRLKQLQYSMLRSLMGRHRDFWRLTEDGLVYARKSLGARPHARQARAPAGRLPDPRRLPRREAGPRGPEAARPSPRHPVQRRAQDAGGGGPSAGIVDLLDDILSVEEVKIFKPSPRVYHLAPEHLRVRPELGFVSSNGWDVAGAASAGLEHLLDPAHAAEVPEELGFQADTTVKAITDLPALLRG